MLSYLNHLKKYCDFNELLALKRDKQKYFMHKNALPYLLKKKNYLKFKTDNFDISTGQVKIGKNDELSEEQKKQLLENINGLIPWKKGPFNLFGEEIDAEWRSDLKWDRISKHLQNLKGKRILDIGCNNGYFMFKMMDQNPELVLGIDPVIQNILQFEFVNSFYKNKSLQFELFGIENLNLFKNMFHVILSMGIIYHHRNPMSQLLDIHNALVPGGEVILETIGIEGEEATALFPEDRYAKMRNVWFIPTMSCLINWTKKAKFIDIEIISNTILDNSEQRLSKYCPPPFQSLDDFLDPNNKELTIEGHPAPRRFCIKARKRK